MDIKIGDTFGVRTVVGYDPTTKKCYTVCKCGNERWVSKYEIANTTSCGCLNKQRMIEYNSNPNEYDLSQKYGIGFTHKGERFLFDLEDYELICGISWSFNKDGYLIGRYNNKNIGIHQLIMGCPQDSMVDHQNGYEWDNRKSNLRICSHAENGRNRKVNVNSKSGVAGVYKAGNKWAAQIYDNGKKVHLGHFDNFEDAVKARKEAEPIYYKEFIRKPDPEIEEFCKGEWGMKIS